MKKLISFLTAALLLLMATTVFAVVPTNEGYVTLENFDAATTADLGKADGITAAFADLSYWGLQNGTQEIVNKQWVLAPTAGASSCQQGSINTAVTDTNTADWANSQGLRFWVESAADADVYLTFYLYFSQGAGANNRPFTTGTAVYLIDETGTVVTPEFHTQDSYANRYFYIPQGFKGWVVIPSTTAANADEENVGWRPTTWSIADGDVDYTKTVVANAADLAIDVRWDAVQGTLTFDDFQLIGASFPAPDASEVLNNGNTTQPPADTADVSTIAYAVAAVIGCGALVIKKKK